MKESLVSLALALAAGPLAAAPTPLPQAGAAGDVLVLHCAGLDEILVDSRDAGLRRALGMLDDRILELIEEFADDEMASAAGELVLDLVSRPMTLRVGVPDPEQEGLVAPFYAQLEVEAGDAAGARALTERFERVVADALGMAGQDLGRDGLSFLTTPAGQLAYGSRTSAPDTFVLALGELVETPAGSLTGGLPEGIEPTLAFRFDGEAAQQPLAMFLPALGSEAAELEMVLSMTGLLGEQPIGVEAAMGHCPLHGHASALVTNYVPMAERTGSLVREPLSERDFQLVPADATMVWLGQSEPSSILSALRMMPDGEQMMDQVIEGIASQTGLHLEYDLFDHLGTTFGFYTSDTTGGGGLFSGVMFLELDSPEGLAQTMENVELMIDELGRAEAEGYVRTRLWKHGEVPCTSLIFPGLPIPLELSWAIQGGYLFAAATPQTLIAALDHAADPGGGDVRSNPRLLEVASPSELGGLIAFQFEDTPRFLKDGYGLGSLAFAALANGVRSPETTRREPGAILPSYAELAAGSVAYVSLGRLAGDDYVTTMVGDRSMSANLVAFLGSPSASLLIPVMAIAGSFGFMTASTASAMAGMEEPYVYSDWDEFDVEYEIEYDVAMLDMTELRWALDAYAVDHGGSYPDDLHALVEPDAGGRTYLGTDSLPHDPWGHDYQYVPPRSGESLWLYSLGSDGEPGGIGSAADLFLDE